MHVEDREADRTTEGGLSARCQGKLAMDVGSASLGVDLPEGQASRDVVER